MSKLAILLPVLAFAGVADSAAQVQRIQARTIWELALRNLQRDTARAGK